MKQKLLTSLLGLLIGKCASTALAVTNTVVIGSYFFNPTNITINLGDTIRWTNTTFATVVHDSTRTNTPFSWASPDLDGSPTTFLLTFSNAGTFSYFCNRHVNAALPQNRHPEQTGTVSVVSMNLSPSVSITNPANNTLFAAPANVTIQATASDSDGSVTNVQFLVGTALVGNDTTAPYATTTNGLPAGNFTLFAIASDNAGARATNSINIAVSAPPSVSLTNPVNNARLVAPANILLQASASDEGSVTNVQFFSGGSLLGSDASAPYSFTLNNAVAGNYSFTARAQDNTGLAATSAVVNVFVLTNATLASPNVLPNGQFWMTIQGIAGQTYATETSTNLANWLAISTNVAPANTFNVTDTTSTNVLQRFYRTRQN